MHIATTNIYIFLGFYKVVSWGKTLEIIWFNESTVRVSKWVLGGKKDKVFFWASCIFIEIVSEFILVCIGALKLGLQCIVRIKRKQDWNTSIKYIKFCCCSMFIAYLEILWDTQIKYKKKMGKKTNQHLLKAYLFHGLIHTVSLNSQSIV